MGIRSAHYSMLDGTTTRTSDNNLIIINQHLPLTLYENTYVVKFPHYFNHLTCLIMEYIDESLFQWIISNVNCSRHNET